MGGVWPSEVHLVCRVRTLLLRGDQSLLPGPASPSPTQELELSDLRTHGLETEAQTEGKVSSREPRDLGAGAGTTCVDS